MPVRLPDPPPPAAQLREIGIRDDEYRTITPEEVWWCVHRTEGEYVLAWNEFRQHGPHLRFDPQPPPAGQHDGVGIWYGAHTPTIALAEAFQGDRTIDRRRGQPYLTGLRFTRPLHLIDITTTSAAAWATRAGGTYGLSTGPHSITQRWARRIVEAFPDVDGLLYDSGFAGGPCIAAFGAAQTAMPPAPVLSLPLTHPGLASRIATAAHRLGYLIY
ncbi:RES family NAD+ phosphorylase [Mycobacteroides abscessus]|nr:RES family NAD+ phosphorylase [Mycobacteroides abscessus]RIR12618.1 RES domain-containing protein [Mycobacteroides abscessus]RIR92160.1 RES domain-containing protein [Mycobacteroides abscessus]